MQDIAIWIQTGANLAIVGTFIVYWRQLVAMRGQLTAAQEASRTQNLIALIEYLQTPELREARSILFLLEGVPLADWTHEQRLAAERVCSAYDVVAILIRDGGVPHAREIIAENWGYSIRRCREVASELITETRKSRGQNYWDDFEWLARQAKVTMPNNALQPTAAAPVSRTGL